MNPNKHEAIVINKWMVQQDEQVNLKWIIQMIQFFPTLFGPLLIIISIMYINFPNYFVPKRSSISTISLQTFQTVSKDIDIDCAICVDPLKWGDPVRSLHCHHIFHSDCIDPWLSHYSNLCPLCKQSVCNEHDLLVLETTLKDF
ncbi:hypothetical protein BC833DRAFT_193579 [Globomyces pollinis-pini]|nr:hypothetical protein BC833DRAFT_193579 [Globomyces pollinis-pini]